MTPRFRHQANSSDLIVKFPYRLNLCSRTTRLSPRPAYCTLTGRRYLANHPLTNFAYRNSTSFQQRTMADDTSYSTFLTKANADPKSGITPPDHNPHAATEQDSKIQSTSQARSKYDPSMPEAGLPTALQNLPDVQYVSDTDSDFRPVFFNYSSDSLPSAEDFKQILAKKGHTNADVAELSEKDFDPRGEYGEIVQKVAEVGNGSEAEGGIKIFRVPKHGARVDYYIVTVGDRKLVGVMTEAVES